MLVVSQVFLVPHQDDGNVGAEVLHLGRPLLRNIFCPDVEGGDSEGGGETEGEEVSRGRVGGGAVRTFYMIDGSCGRLEAKMFLAALILLPIKSIRAS